MATNKHAIIRYQALDKCFSNRGRKFYIGDLIDACNEALYDHTGDEKFSDPLNPGISRRQILDDISFMESDAGWAIPLDHIKDGKKTYYRYSDKKFTINNQPLTDEEVSQLRETTLMLSRFKGLPQFEWIDSMITNLEDKFHLKSAEHSVIGLDSNDCVDGLEYISPLFNAILNKIPLHIEYNTFHKGSHSWVIHPYYLKQYNNRWFLIGLNNDEYRSITNVALDRIASIKQAHVSYIENTVIDDFDDYFYDIVGVSFPLDKTIKEVVLKFSEHRFPYIKAKPIHGSHRVINEEERLILLKLIPNRELESILLSFGDDVEIISPKELRGTIANKIKKSYEKYFPVQNDCTDGTELCNVNQEQALHNTTIKCRIKNEKTSAD